MNTSKNYNYFYYLVVSGNEEDKEKVLTELKRTEVLGKYLEPRGDKKAPGSYGVSVAYGYVNEWNENQQEELLHKIALKVPNATLILQGETEELDGPCYRKDFRGDRYQEVRQDRLTQKTMPPITVENFIRFDDREKKPDEVYILCEEYENNDGIRQFGILGVSTEKELLQEILQEQIEKDPYGFIESKGVADRSEDSFRTNFKDGFVEYYIREEQVLTRELLKQREQEKESKEPSLDEKISDAAARQQNQVNRPSQSQNKDRKEERN